MIMDGDRENTLGALLPDHIVVEHLVDLGRRGNPVASLDQCRLGFLTDDVVAQLDAFIADEDGRARDQLADLVLRLAAEAAVKRALAVATAGKLGHSGPLSSQQAARAAAGHAKPVYRTIKLADGLTTLSVPSACPKYGTSEHKGQGQVGWSGGRLGG